MEKQINEISVRVEIEETNCGYWFTHIKGEKEFMEKVNEGLKCCLKSKNYGENYWKF